MISCVRVQMLWGWDDGDEGHGEWVRMRYVEGWGGHSQCEMSLAASSTVMHDMF